MMGSTTSSTSWAVTELIVRIKVIIIIVTSSEIILLVLLLAATKEESLLRSGVQKVIWLSSSSSSCSWMTNIYIYKRQMGNLKCYGLATLSLADGNIAIKSFTAPSLLPCKGEELSN